MGAPTDSRGRFADGLAVRRELQHRRLAGDAGRRVGRVRLHERADRGVQRVRVHAGQSPGEGGGHGQPGRVPVRDLQGGENAGAPAAGPADHAAHRAHPAQQGAGRQADQHRPAVRDQV
nr:MULTISPECIES: hypothetical protein [Streptomyces]